MSVERRRPGRPRLAANDTTTEVTVKMPASLYDQAYQLSREQRVNFSELIRSALQRAVDTSFVTPK